MLIMGHSPNQNGEDMDIETHFQPWGTNQIHYEFQAPKTTWNHNHLMFFQ